MTISRPDRLCEWTSSTADENAIRLAGQRGGSAICRQAATQKIVDRFYCDHHAEKVIENIRNLRAHFESISAKENSRP